LSSFQLRRLARQGHDQRAAAPMAPPSVGVAMPRKMVPSTRKISSQRRHQRRQHAQQQLAAAQGARFGGSAGAQFGLKIATRTT
jgi:hypothetical protein